MNEIKLMKREYPNACNTKFEIEFNDLKGGDAGHGGFLRLKFEQDTEIEVKTTKTSVEIKVTGDDERIYLKHSLKAIADFLENNLKYNYGNTR